MQSPTPPKGRGAGINPVGRFEKLNFDDFREVGDGDEAVNAVGPRRTEYFDDASESVLTTNDSPDVGFDASVNPYRGCEHGCIYCYARPTHEYLGLSAGVDFETKILVKREAPTLLRKALLSRSWKPQTINLSGVTDCYQPIERKLRLTRGCIEVLEQFRNPFSIITKNFLVTRDLDLIRPAAERNTAMVMLSITSLDEKLIERMEPRTSRPRFRLQAIEQLAKAGVPVGVMVAPVVPGLTDAEMPAILKSAADAGARFAGFVPLRLPYGLGPLFEDWLTAHFPDRRQRILNRVREIRGGKLNDPNFNSRMRGQGAYAEQLRSMFHLYTRKYGLNGLGSAPDLTTAHFRRVEDPDQLTLF